MIRYLACILLECAIQCVDAAWKDKEWLVLWGLYYICHNSTDITWKLYFRFGKTYFKMKNLNHKLYDIMVISQQNKKKRPQHYNITDNIPYS